MSALRVLTGNFQPPSVLHSAAKQTMRKCIVKPQSQQSSSVHLPVLRMMIEAYLLNALQTSKFNQVNLNEM